MLFAFISDFLGTVGRTYGHYRFNDSAARRYLGYFNIHTECLLYIILCHYIVCLAANTSSVISEKQCPIRYSHRVIGEMSIEYTTNPAVAKL